MGDAKENPLYIEVWRRVSEDVENLPKDAVMHLTQIVNLIMSREEMKSQ
jgi:hypothetical protein